MMERQLENEERERRDTYAIWISNQSSVNDLKLCNPHPTLTLQGNSKSTI